MANKEASLLLRIKSAGEEKLASIREGLEQVGTVAIAAFAVVGAAIAKAIQEYSAQEAAVNSLNRTLVNNGTYSRETAAAYIAQAEALSKLTLFGDEQIIQAQSAFQQQARNVNLTKEATAAILDFAQAQGIDAASAAELVGKSVGTTTNALARYGVQVDTNASQSEKLAQVMDGLNSKFGGQAEAATQGLGGLQMLSKSVGELFESLGARLSPAITTLANQFNLMIGDSAKFEGFIDGIGTAFEFVIKTSQGVIFAFESLGTIIGGTLSTLATALVNFATGDFSKIKSGLVSGFNDLGTELEALTLSYADKMKAIDDAALESKAQKYQQEEQMLADSLARKAEVEAVNRESQRVLELESELAKQDEQIALIGAKEEEKNAVLLKAAEQRLTNAKTDKDKIAAMEQIYQLKEEQRAIKLREFKEKQNQLSLQGYSQFFGGLASLSQSSNSQLAGIGKAAAISQATIDAYLAIQRTLASVPFPANVAASVGIGVTAFANVSKIAGVPLAEGGIVMPRPGGTQATIGEAGQAEAVIPLDRAGEFGLGGGGSNVTIVVNGGLLGSESEAREFAIAIDRELLKLRRNNESVSFDSGVI